jgi:hypothetical protein
MSGSGVICACIGAEDAVRMILLLDKHCLFSRSGPFPDYQGLALARISCNWSMLTGFTK